MTCWHFNTPYAGNIDWCWEIEESITNDFDECLVGIGLKIMWRIVGVSKIGLRFLRLLLRKNSVFIHCRCLYTNLCKKFYRLTWQIYCSTMPKQSVMGSACRCCAVCDWWTNAGCALHWAYSWIMGAVADGKGVSFYNMADNVNYTGRRIIV